MSPASRWARHLLTVAAIVSAASVPLGGQSSSRITFVENRWPSDSPSVVNRGSGPSQTSPGGTIQFGQTSATSNQHSTGNTQTNEGTANAVSVQQQSGLGGATQTTNNQGVIQALQQAAGGAHGGGAGGQQSSNNQVNINSNQLQQNVEGTLVNVNAGNKGIVIVNTNDPETGIVTGQKVVNNRPIAPATSNSSKCRYTCRRSTGQTYCCDFGSNRGGPPAIHGGQCPPARLICPNGNFFRKCAHDGQCEKSDKCCYDACANHHICKPPDSF